MVVRYEVHIMVVYTCGHVSKDLEDYCVNLDPDRCTFQVSEQKFARLVNFLVRNAVKRDRVWYLSLEHGHAMVTLDVVKLGEDEVYTTLCITCLVHDVDVKCEDILNELMTAAAKLHDGAS